METRKTIRQRIVEAVLARFRTITPANGYNFDFSQKVFEWKDGEYTYEELPAANVMDVKDTTEEGASMPTRQHTHKLDFETVLTTARKNEVSTAPVTSADVRKMIADFTASIGEDRRWTVAGVDLAFQTSPVSDEMDVVKGEKYLGQVRMKFTISFRTLAFDPYEQG